MKFSVKDFGKAMIPVAIVWVFCRVLAPAYIGNWYAWFGPQWVVYLFDICMLLCAIYYAIDK